MENQLGKIAKKSDGYQVVFERLLNHPLQQVWEAITDPEQLKYWFTDIEMDFREGGKITFRFRDKDKTLSHGEIVRIDPPHQFAWTWEGELAVWDLKKLDKDRTQLTLTYSKLSPDYAINAPAGFHDLLDRLEARLGGSSVSHAFGTEQHDPKHLRLQVHYAASVYYNFPEVVNTKPVDVEKDYDAPVEQVWKAITDKDQMKQWYFDLDEFKPEKGFRFTFKGQGPKGAMYTHVCTVTEVVPERKLQYSWEYENHPGYSLVTFQLQSIEGKTRLRLTHHGLETFPQDHPDFAWKNFNGGWNEIANLLNEFLKNN